MTLAFGLAGGDGLATAGPLEDVYTVADVRVDRTAESASSARDEALAIGQAGAFDRLLIRLAPRSAVARVERPDPETLRRLVQGFEIANEKTSAVRYIASLTFRFKPSEMRNWMRDNGVDYAETSSKPVLVVPVYRAAGVARLWEDGNPWFDAWARLPARDSLVPIAVPLGDLVDIAGIGATDALDGNTERLTRLSSRYGDGDVLVAVAEIGLDPESGLPVANLTLTRYGAGAPQVSVASLTGGGRDDLDGLMDRAAVESAAVIEDSWKRDNLRQTGALTEIAIDVPISNLVDWLAVRKRLAGVPLVERSDMVSITRARVRLSLRFSGGVGQLKIALAQSDLKLDDAEPFPMLGLAAPDFGAGAP